MDFEQILFPHIPLQNWQMTHSERIAFTGLLARLRPRGAIEVGVYYGGSLALISQFAEHTIAIDIDHAVLDRVPARENVDIVIKPSEDAIPEAFAAHAAAGRPVNLVLVDADHSYDGVRRDLELVLQHVPTAPMFILMHDTGNPDTRRGILSVDWAANPHVQMIDCDFVPGQIIEHSVLNGRGEIWGGLGLAYLDPLARIGKAPDIRQSSATTLRCLHRCMDNLDSMAAGKLE